MAARETAGGSSMQLDSFDDDPKPASSAPSGGSADTGTSTVALGDEQAAAADLAEHQPAAGPAAARAKPGAPDAAHKLDATPRESSSEEWRSAGVDSDDSDDCYDSDWDQLESRVVELDDESETEAVDQGAKSSGEQATATTTMEVPTEAVNMEQAAATSEAAANREPVQPAPQAEASSEGTPAVPPGLAANSASMANPEHAADALGQGSPTIGVSAGAVTADPKNDQPVDAVVDDELPDLEYHDRYMSGRFDDRFNHPIGHPLGPLPDKDYFDEIMDDMLGPEQPGAARRRGSGSDSEEYYDEEVRARRHQRNKDFFNDVDRHMRRFRSPPRPQLDMSMYDPSIPPPQDLQMGSYLTEVVGTVDADEPEWAHELDEESDLDDDSFDSDDYYDARDRSGDVDDGSDYDGDDEEVYVSEPEQEADGEEGEIVPQPATYQVSEEELEHIRAMQRRTAIIGEMGYLNSLNIEALTSMWPMLVKKIDPAKMMDLLFLSGNLLLPETTEIKRLNQSRDTRKAAVRLLLSIAKKRPNILDAFFRTLIEVHPELKAFVLKHLHDQCTKVIPREVSTMSTVIKTQGRQGESLDIKVTSAQKDMLTMVAKDMNMLIDSASILQSRHERKKKTEEQEKPKTEWKTIIRPNLEYLESRVAGMEVISRCIDRELLTEEDFKKVLPKLTDSNHMALLYRVVRNTGSTGYRLFIDILKSFGDKYRDIHHHLFRFGKKLKEEENKKAEEKMEEELKQKEQEQEAEALRQLPETCSPFLGRDDLLKTAMGKVHDMGEGGDCRILALRGTYGCGKSTIAGEIAHRVTGEDKLAIFYVPLRGCSTAPLATRRIIHTISPRCIGSGLKTLDEEITSIDDAVFIVLDNLEDCILSAQSGNITQLNPGDYAITDVLKLLLQRQETIRIVLTCRSPIPLEDGVVCDIEVPPLDPSVTYKLFRELAPSLSKTETKEAASFSNGIPLAIHLLTALAKYNSNTMTEVIQEAAERWTDMNIPGWARTEHLLYILVELVVEGLNEPHSFAFGALCILHAAFTIDSVLHILHYCNPHLVERHLLKGLKQRRMVQANPMLGRFVVQPVALKHGFAMLEDYEHRMFRNTFVTYYFNLLNHIVGLEPNTMQEVESMQDHFNLDYPHFVRAFRYVYDVLDQDAALTPITFNIMTLAFPNDNVYSFLRRGAHLSMTTQDFYARCATHLTQAYFEELLHEWTYAMHSLGQVFRNIVAYVKSPGVTKDACVPYHELMYYCRLLERRCKLRLGSFSQEEAQQAATAAFNEFHSWNTPSNVLTLLTDLYTQTCACEWDAVLPILLETLDAIKTAMSDTKEVTEAIRVAISKYACDAVIVLVALVTTALRDENVNPSYRDILRAAIKLRRLGQLLKPSTDQRDAADELTRRWFQMYYDQNIRMDGIPFQQLFTASLRSRRFTKFPADPMVIGPGTGLPDWLMTLQVSNVLRLFMETTFYEQSPEAEQMYGQFMSELTDEEQKLMLLLSQAWQYEHYLLTPFLEEWEEKYKQDQTWLVVTIEGIPFCGSEIISYILLLGIQMSLAREECSVPDDELVWIFKSCRVSACCGECLRMPGPSEKMHYCQRCTVVMYCDRNCQKKHYTKHKKHCARLNTIKRKAHL